MGNGLALHRQLAFCLQEYHRRLKEEVKGEGFPYVILVYNLSQTELLDIHKLKLDILIQDIMSDKITITKRKELYEQGGIFNVSPQTVVTDILSKKFTPSIITGICVLNCHEVKSKINVEYSLRLFREEN